MPEDDDLTQLWMYISETVQHARLNGDLREANELLAAAHQRPSRRRAHRGDAPVARRQLRSGNAIEEASAAFEELAQSHGKLTFSGKEDGYAWAAYSLERKADREMKAGDVDKAIGTYDRILNPSDKASSAIQSTTGWDNCSS